MINNDEKVGFWWAVGLIVGGIALTILLLEVSGATDVFINSFA